MSEICYYLLIKITLEFKKMKKIAIFAGYYPPTIGGYPKNVHEIARRLVKRGYQVDVYTCNVDGSPTQEQVDKVNIFRLPTWNALGGVYPIPKPTLTTIKTIYRVLRTNYHLFNIQTRFFLICALGWFLAVIKFKPLIYMERGSVHSVVDNPLVNLISITYDHLFGLLITQKAVVNMGVSSASAQFIKHLGARNPIVMPNGIDMALFKDNNNPNTKNPDQPDKDNKTFYQDPKTSHKDTSSTHEDKIVITFIGRIVYAKGAQDLISALKDNESNFKLLIVGDGPYKEELEKIASEHPSLKGRIEFLGYKTGKEIPEILKQTDIFVNPSYSEGLPTSVMEACAAGCATIATDVGGTNEIILDQITGLLYTPHNCQELQEKLNYLIENPTLRKEYAQKAQSYVEKEFSWDKITNKWIGLIENV